MVHTIWVTIARDLNKHWNKQDNNLVPIYQEDFMKEKSEDSKEMTGDCISRGVLENSILITRLIIHYYFKEITVFVISLSSGNLQNQLLLF